MKIKLSPCPFCGGQAKLVQIQGDNHDYWADGLFFIEVNHNWNGRNKDQPCILYSVQFGHYKGGYNRKTGEYSPITEEAKMACAKWNDRRRDRLFARTTKMMVAEELRKMVEVRNPNDMLSIEDIVRERTICEMIERIYKMSLD